MDYTTLAGVRARQRVERRIARAAVNQLLRDGFKLSVNDGCETTLIGSTDPKAIMAAMFTTDEDYILVDQVSEEEGGLTGWVFFVYGNDGWDVISDYTVNLEPHLTDAEQLADKIERQLFR